MKNTKLVDRIKDIKYDLSNDRITDDSLETKIVLACSLIESFEYDDAKISKINLEDNSFEWNKKELNKYNRDITNLFNEWCVILMLPRTKTCLDILNAIENKKPLDKTWESSVDDAYKNGYLADSVLNHLLYDLNKSGKLNFPYIEKYSDILEPVEEINSEYKVNESKTVKLEI